jgi:hypothetical protein
MVISLRKEELGERDDLSRKLGAPLKCIWQENCETRVDYTTLVEL